MAKSRTRSWRKRMRAKLEHRREMKSGTGKPQPLAVRKKKLRGGSASTASHFQQKVYRDPERTQEVLKTDAVIHQSPSLSPLESAASIEAKASNGGPRILRDTPPVKDAFAEVGAAAERARDGVKARGYTTVQLILNSLLDAKDHKLSLAVLRDKARIGRDHTPVRFHEVVRRLRTEEIISIDNGGKPGRPGGDAVVTRVAFGQWPTWAEI